MPGTQLRDLRERVTQLANEGGDQALPDIAAAVAGVLDWSWSMVVQFDLIGEPAPIWSSDGTPDAAFAVLRDTLRALGSTRGARQGFLDAAEFPGVFALPFASRVRTENVLLFGLPSPDGPGEVPGSPDAGRLAALDDVRTQTELLLERRRTLAELERSNEELARFAYVASHDLQEPLRKITGFLGLLEARYAAQLDDEAREFIGFAVGGAERLQQLISDLLAYSRLGRTDHPAVSVDLGELMARIVADLDLPPEAVDVGDLPTVSGYRSELGQLFGNLVHNAVKFAGPDGPELTVRAAYLPGRWVVEVTDRGIGIPEDQLRRVFDPFFRGHPAHRYPGSGVGLAICRKVAERHGGGIDVASTPGVTTTFRVSLPGAPT